MLDFNELLKKDEEYMAKFPESIGWEYYTLGLTSTEAKRLEASGILIITFKSNKHVLYRVNKDRINEILSRTLDKPNMEIFDDIEGYDDVKTLIIDIFNNKDTVNGVLFIGPPASAKSMFLDALNKINGAVYVEMNETTKAGLNDILFEEQPLVLLIDELDKGNRKDYSSLLSLLQSGRVQKHTHSTHIDIKLNTKVFAAANYIERIPIELQSRFIIIRFREYTKEQIKNIGYHMLRHNKIGKVIVDASINAGIVKDPRDFMKINRIVGEDIDKLSNIVTIMKKYQ